MSGLTYHKTLTKYAPMPFKDIIAYVIFVCEESAVIRRKLWE